MLISARRHGEHEKVELLESVLKDEDVFDLVCDSLDHDYTSSGAASFQNPVQNLLKWLVDHQTEIFAAIKLALQILAIL